MGDGGRSAAGDVVDPPGFALSRKAPDGVSKVEGVNKIALWCEVSELEDSCAVHF